MSPKNVKVKFGYCDYCEKEIEKPAKRPLDELQKTIVAIISGGNIDSSLFLKLQEIY